MSLEQGLYRIHHFCVEVGGSALSQVEYCIAWR